MHIHVFRCRYAIVCADYLSKIYGVYRSTAVERVKSRLIENDGAIQLTAHHARNIKTASIRFFDTAIEETATELDKQSGATQRRIIVMQTCTELF